MGITTDIRDRLITIERLMEYESSNVKAAVYIPRKFADFQIPLFINFPTGGARARFADTFYDITRPWTLSLWGQKVGDGLMSYNEDRMMDLIDLTYELFLTRPRLEVIGQAMNYVTSALITGDGGIDIRSYPGDGGDQSAYYVVDFTAEITYRVACL